MKKSSLFDDLHRYLADLDEMLPEEDEFLASKMNQYSVSMVMMNIINTCIDIAHEIIARKKLGYPGTYREAFTLLAKNKIISVPLSKKMMALVGLRNILAHEYGEVNLELLYEQASDLLFINDYIKSAAALSQKVFS
ncbi:hypothetical protein COV20_01345 [Candidatus Woesearchaeota archaeon CG10_big_fil_rev_8_21_14_0_10_45_16]|nr:MAG: hypothetical protein COV20_01345 [Candidatus Woesearchaeota archaeon CG10_big_fil_rev_8_21_14_0_10_45_16]